MSPVWYLDDGTFIGTRSAIATLLTKLQSLGPDLGIHLNMAKCKVFRPSGDQTFKDLLSHICRVILFCGGVDLLGSPIIYRSTEFYNSYIASRVEKVLKMQACLEDLDNP